MKQLWFSGIALVLAACSSNGTNGNVVGNNNSGGNASGTATTTAGTNAGSATSTAGTSAGSATTTTGGTSSGDTATSASSTTGSNSTSGSGDTTGSNTASASSTTTGGTTATASSSTTGTTATTGTTGRSTTGSTGATGTTGRGTTGTGTTGRGTGTTGTTGATTGGTTGTTGSATPTGSVLERNNHPSRDGLFTQPALTKAAAATMAKDTGFAATFTGAMWASPLYLENSGKGIFFAVTTGNDVIALDETTGTPVWTHNIGSSPQQSGAGCGSIHPIGILSTPVIDATAGTIYVAGAIGTASIANHQIHALSVTDGTERPGWPVDASKLAAGSLPAAPTAYNQRSALSLVNGILYVAYGGHVGDCGTYHGVVVGINTQDPTKSASWTSLGVGEGTWQAGGMASDGTAIFAPTGNSTVRATSRTASDSEEIVRLTGLAAFTRSNANLFYPSRWQAMDSSDADMSANSPVYVNTGGTNFVVALSKDGHMYLLDPNNLGGSDGYKVDFAVATGAMVIHTVPSAFTNTKGAHVVFSIHPSATAASVCPGGVAGQAIMSVLIPPGASPKPTVEWCSAFGGAVTSPVITTTDGTANPVVWFMNNGKLSGVDGDTGAAIYTSSDSCSGVRQWTSPIAVKGRIVAGGDTHLCSWSPH